MFRFEEPRLTTHWLNVEDGVDVASTGVRFRLDECKDEGKWRENSFGIALNSVSW